MAVKAKEQVTVSWIIDIASTTKYYLLQSSTATPPSKPTANPPGGNWKTAEPAYTSGSTNTLYTIEQTLWTNGKVTYSAVCKSSSYEAAKEAWNKAQNAQNTANSANSKIDGLKIGGRNLARNTSVSKTWTSKSSFANDTWVGSDGGSGWLPKILIEKNTEYTISFDYVLENLSEDVGVVGVGIGSGKGTNYEHDSWDPYAQYATYGGSTTSGHFVYHLAAKNYDNKYFAFRPLRRSGTATLTTPIKLTISHFKLEKGNMATDWTPAPEDTDAKIESYVESEIKKEEDSIKLWVGQTYTAKTEFNTLSGRTSTLETWKNEASQKITKDGIIATVGSYYTKESDFQSATTRITNAESRIAQLNDSIELKVEKNGIISAINQTSEKVTIAASKVDLSGYVSISNLKTAGKTVIDGSNITTGTVSADRIDAKSLFAKQLDATNLHVTGKSTFDGVLNGATGTFSGTLSVTRSFSSGDASVIIGADNTSRAITLKPAGLTTEYGITYDGNAVMDVVTANYFNGNTSHALTLRNNGDPKAAAMTFHWTGKDGQPTWMWGGNDANDMYVYNPSNFSVASAAVSTHMAMPRVGTDVNANGRPALNRAFWREYNSACAYLPDASWYHIFTGQGPDDSCTTQLALGMTTQKVAYRYRFNSKWGYWREIPLLDKNGAFGKVTIVGGLYDTYGNTNTTTNLNQASYVTSNGRIARYASSSKRYKHDIAEIFDVTCTPEALYDLPVVTYRYNDGYCQDEPHGEKLHIGFIAEDVAKLYPVGCGYVNGVPENWNVMEMVPGMLRLIQDQHKDIIKQSTRQDAVESRMNSLQYQLAQAFDRIAALEKENKSLRQALS